MQSLNKKQRLSDLDDTRRLGLIFLFVGGGLWFLLPMVLVYLLFFAPGPDVYGKFLLEQPPYYEMSPVTATGNVVAIKPKNLSLKKCREVHGEPEEERHVVRRFEDSEDRPIIYTLHAYKSFVVVTSDLEPDSDTIVMVLTRVAK